jgi:hypothetical protein
MRFRISWAGAAVAAATVLLPIKAGGCGRTACITFSQAKYDKNGGSCPSSADAMTRFNGPCGGGVISAVNGDGIFDGEFCCYDVMTDDSFIGDCFGGFAGSPGTAGFGGIGGVGGGPLPCDPCSTALTQGVFNPLCGGNSQSTFSALQSCGCSFCPTECNQTLCSDVALDTTCGDCLSVNCGTEFTDCSNDV